MITISRQAARAEKRGAAKQRARREKVAARAKAKQLLRARQLERERDGLYSGIPLYVAMAPSRSRVAKRKVRKGQPFGRFLHGNYHATKGWRAYNV